MFTVCRDLAGEKFSANYSGYLAKVTLNRVDMSTMDEEVFVQEISRIQDAAPPEESQTRQK